MSVNICVKVQKFISKAVYAPANDRIKPELIVTTEIIASEMHMLDSGGANANSNTSHSTHAPAGNINQAANPQLEPVAEMKDFDDDIPF